MMSGWIKIHRKIQDNIFWNIKPFSKAQAWIDLLLMMNHSDKDVIFRDSIYNIKRGQHITSELKLGKRWGWSRTKIKNFLKLLQNHEMLVLKSDNRKCIITVLNYETYQSQQTTDDTTGDTTSDTTG